MSRTRGRVVGGEEARSALESASRLDRRPGAGWRVGGWAAVGAGVFGLLGLVSVIPWPELFSLDANPGNALVLNPELKVVLVGHYAILVAGGVLGTVAAVTLVGVLRSRPIGLAGAVLLTVACLGLGHASLVRAIDMAANAGRPSQDVEAQVWAGGAALLVAVVLLTLALRSQASRGFLLLGLIAPALVVAGVTAFAVLGAQVYPEIWGVTFPPPTDYLLAGWFVSLGRLMLMAGHSVAQVDRLTSSGSGGNFHRTG